jgi:hypothetical protein
MRLRLLRPLTFNVMMQDWKREILYTEMKTPLQELMDEFAKKADSLPDTLDANVAYLAFQECYDIAKSMLKKEMAVIIEAFHEGMRCQGWDPNRGIAEEYYNETFNTK